MVHKKRTVNKVVAKKRHSVVTPKYLAQILNIGLDKQKQMLWVTTQRGICMAVHLIIRRYRTYHLNLLCKFISGRWYVDWMPSAETFITQCRGAFI